MSERPLAGRTAAVTTIYLASAAVGLLRILVIADLFGASRDADAYIIASVIPFLVFDLVTDGTLASAFVPIATRVEKNRGSMVIAPLAGSFLVLALVLGLLVAGGVSLAASTLSALLAPGFDADGQDLVARLLTLMTPAILLSTATGSIMAILFFRDRVVLSTANTLLFNIAIVGFALALAPSLGIRAMSFGVIAGAALQLLAQMVILRGIEPGTLGLPRVNSQTLGDLGEIGLLLLPLLGMLIVGYGSSLVNNMVASSLDPGSATAIHFAGRLVRLPAGVFAMAVAFVAFPRVARLSAAGDLPSSAEVVSKSLRYSLAVSLPGSILLMVLAEPLVELLFHRGAFDSEDVALTARVLMVYAPAAVGFAVAEIMRRSSYALADTRSPLKYHLVVSLIQVPVMIGFARVWGTAGIPLATTLAVSINAALLVRRVNRTLPIDWRADLLVAVRILAASLLAGALALAAVRALNGGAEWTGDRAALTVAVGGLTGVIGFLLGLRVLWPSGSRELWEAVAAALPRTSGRRDA
ncbi:MAG: murein biosynthesis integral membrane protein MurJ [Thermoleophilia bacterium]